MAFLKKPDDLAPPADGYSPVQNPIPPTPQPQPLPEQTAPGAAAPPSPNKIGEEQAAEAETVLRKYKDGKTKLERRIIENEQWYKIRHWDQIRRNKPKDPNDPEPASAWLFNSIANKHADAMDNFPEPNVLPREESDKPAAEQLSHILPVVLERNEFEQTYSDVWWYKLKTGTGAYGVFWNKSLDNGLGDIDIKQMDILNIFWEPGVKDLQKSKNLFTVELVDNDILEQNHPALKGKLGSASVDIARYIYDDTVDTSEKSAVVDWYYKLQSENGTVLHYCKFVGNTVLYASENDPAYAERGFYDHAEYPFVFDTLFVEEGTPCGFGYIDIMKDTQMYIDKLNQSVIRNALMTSKRRFFIKNSGSVNEEEFADFSKDFVHVEGSNLGEDSIREIRVEPLNALYVNIIQQKIDELKETSGNRDFTQGGTSGGVTAASAIAALQEAGSKLSRDMIKSGYRAFQKVNYLCLELIRQFYDEPRYFRITGKAGERQFVQFSNSGIKAQPQENDFGLELGSRKPVFDIQITSQRSSPFSKIAQNELAQGLYKLGMFSPQMADQALVCLDMMDFEGKEMVIQKVTQNQTLLQTVKQLQQQMRQMAVLVDKAYGSPIQPAMAQEMGARGHQDGQPLPPASGGERNVQTDALGEAFVSAAGTNANTAKQKAAGAAAPKS